MRYKIIKKGNIFPIIVLIIILSLFMITKSINIQKETLINKTKNRLNKISNEINNTESILKIKTTELERLLNESYQELYNPPYKKAIELIENNTLIKPEKIIENFKNNSIRCALAIIEVSSNNNVYMKKLISIETLENDMIYFEPDSNFLVDPVIGKNYTDCVYNNPYNGYNKNIISDILLIW